MNKWLVEVAYYEACSQQSADCIHSHYNREKVVDTNSVIDSD
jgi:hypothetical protein